MHDVRLASCPVLTRKGFFRREKARTERKVRALRRITRHGGTGSQTSQPAPARLETRKICPPGQYNPGISVAEPFSSVLLLLIRHLNFLPRPPRLGPLRPPVILSKSPQPEVRTGSRAPAIDATVRRQAAAPRVNRANEATNAPVAPSVRRSSKASSAFLIFFFFLLLFLAPPANVNTNAVRLSFFSDRWRSTGYRYRKTRKKVLSSKTSLMLRLCRYRRSLIKFSSQWCHPYSP